MKEKLLTLACLVSFIAVASSCANDEDGADGNIGNDIVELSFRVSPFTILPFENTRSADISDVCGKIALAIYKDGKMDTVITRTKEDADFCSPSVRLERGAYTALVMAHDAAKEPDMIKPEKINFGDDNLTDVLYWYGNINASTDSTLDLPLRRAVAKVEVTSTDSLRSDARQVRIWFSGGSYIFDATKGKAARSVNDYKLVELSDNERGKPLAMDFYTFPTDSGKLDKVSITIGYGKGTNSDFKTINDVPVMVNTITRLSGRLGE